MPPFLNPPGLRVLMARDRYPCRPRPRERNRASENSAKGVRELRKESPRAARSKSEGPCGMISSWKMLRITTYAHHFTSSKRDPVYTFYCTKLCVDPLLLPLSSSPSPHSSKWRAST